MIPSERRQGDRGKGRSDDNNWRRLSALLKVSALQKTVNSPAYQLVRKKVYYSRLQREFVSPEEEEFLIVLRISVLESTLILSTLVAGQRAGCGNMTELPFGGKFLPFDFLRTYCKYCAEIT